MTKTQWILIALVVAALIGLALYFVMKAPKYQYQGSNYYGGGNVEEQLAFISGYTASMQNPYS